MSVQLRLLGNGLDAIIQRDVTTMPAAGVSAGQRLRRYQRAVCAHPDRWHGLRVRFGEVFRAAWRQGLRPDLRVWQKRFAQIERACR